MLEKKFKKNNLIINYFNLKNLIYIFCFVSIITTSTVLIFVYALNREWFDGLSVSAILCIGISLLAIIFKFSEFKTIHKLKAIFEIKKENKEYFTKLEQKQMNILNISFKRNKEKRDKKHFYFIFLSILTYGIVILLISLPFLF